MKLVDADLLLLVINKLRDKHKLDSSQNDEWIKYWDKEFEIYDEVLKAIRAATSPEITVVQSKHDTWVPCDMELPPVGADVILTYRDTFHTHESWPKVSVMPAWICNIDDDNPKGQWAIEGRLGNYVLPIEDGIAWMPMPEPYKGEGLE